MAQSIATARAGPASARMVARSIDGNTGSGSESGSAPTVVTSRWPIAVIAVASTTAIREAGMFLCHRGSSTITAATTATITRAGHSVGQLACSSDCPATTRVESPCAATPVTSGICCRKMMAAMPRVNPSTTGHGR